MAIPIYVPFLSVRKPLKKSHTNYSTHQPKPHESCLADTLLCYTNAHTHAFSNKAVQMHSHLFRVGFSSWMNEHSVMTGLKQNRGTNTVLVKRKNTSARVKLLLLISQSCPPQISLCSHGALQPLLRNWTRTERALQELPHN